MRASECTMLTLHDNEETLRTPLPFIIVSCMHVASIDPVSGWNQLFFSFFFGFSAIRVLLRKHSSSVSWFGPVSAGAFCLRISTNRYEGYRRLSRGWLPTRLKLTS